MIQFLSGLNIIGEILENIHFFFQLPLQLKFFFIF